MNFNVPITLVVLLGISGPSLAYTLIVREVDPSPSENALIEQPDQLPQSRAVRGNRDIVLAWLAGPTPRYKHGVLGDDLEASKLRVEMYNGDIVEFELPPSRVFEDLGPRLEDLDGDNKDEILVVESDINLGASLSVFGIIKNSITRRAMTPFLGRPNRWLNPVGVGDFNADGRPDIAIVVTPHIGGILRLYHFTEPTLSLFAESTGVSTHQIGSTELGLGQVVTLTDDKVGLLLPDQSRRALILFQWSSIGVRELARTNLPAPIASSLTPVSSSRWRFKLHDGQNMEIRWE